MNTWSDQGGAVERNQQMLVTVVAALFAMAGLTAAQKTLPRYLHRSVLRLLRPAEAAARRLVIVVARSMMVSIDCLRPYRWKIVRLRKRAKARTPLALPLFDRLNPHRRVASPVATSVPRISAPGITELFAIPPRHRPRPHDEIDASRLLARLAALQATLKDLAPHARRVALWQARQNFLRARSHTAPKPDAKNAWRFLRNSPLKAGRPPGRFRRSRAMPARHPIHDVLDHTHCARKHVSECRRACC
jgi:hypothetical protein